MYSSGEDALCLCVAQLYISFVLLHKTINTVAFKKHPLCSHSSVGQKSRRGAEGFYSAFHKAVFATKA